MRLVQWYQSEHSPWGFFQIGGGISGDFPICVVPLIRQDLEVEVPLWSYFCQVSDSTTSYGSYSGATPNEKITWEKLGPDTPRFIIESDATIVCPLVFAYVCADGLGPKLSEVQLEVRPELVSSPDDCAVCVLVE